VRERRAIAVATAGAVPGRVGELAMAASEQVS